MLILVASCRSYSDAWTPFCTLFERFWPDCPYRKVLFSDKPEVMPDLRGFSFTDLKRDQGWIENLLTVLEFSDFKTVMVFQEDFFLCYPVDQSRIARILEWFEKSDQAACYLYPMGHQEGPEMFESIGHFPMHVSYRVSCQVALWKRDKLLELCRRLREIGRNSVQEFELWGSQLIDDFKLACWIRKDNQHPETWPISYQCSAIARGKWMAGAVKFCLDQGIVLNPKRPTQEASA